MAGEILEVVGGGASGLIVHVSKESSSPQFPERLSSGSLVVSVQRHGERIRYNRIAGTGTGPNSGWVKIRHDGKDLLAPADVKPPRSGWKVLSAELPVWTPPEKLPALESAPQVKPPPMPVARPQEEARVKPQMLQTPGSPFVYYQQIGFTDTKTSGLRLSSCLAAMDNCRTDMFALTDQTMMKFKKVEDPLTQVAIELRPEIRRLSEDDGLLYFNPDSRSPILSWVRLEAEIGWPPLPLRHEEQGLFLVGKDKTSAERTELCRARFQVCFLDSDDKPLQGDAWSEDMNKFWAKLTACHTADRLNANQLKAFYPAAEGTVAGLPFTPTQLKKVTWRMSHCYGDLWGRLYHPRVAELLWDVNMAAGGPFAKLLKQDLDPQAMSIHLAKKMSVGEVFDCFCFVQPDCAKAVYVLFKEGTSQPSDVVLCVCALYNWTDAPQDGKTLKAEDLDLTAAAQRVNFVNFIMGKDPKKSKYMDLTGVERLS